MDMMNCTDANNILCSDEHDNEGASVHINNVDVDINNVDVAYECILWMHDVYTFLLQYRDDYLT